MLEIAEVYAKQHSISFSTNKDPKKSKTKGIIFDKKIVKNNDISPIKLNRDALPWVDSAKYLGNTITSLVNGQLSDILTKRAIYIRKNSELLQEFYFLHPELLMNNIYNSSFPGSVLLDFTSRK